MESNHLIRPLNTSDNYLICFFISSVNYSVCVQHISINLYYLWLYLPIIYTLKMLDINSGTLLCMSTKLLKRHSRCERNLASKMWVFRKHFSTILKVLQKKTSNQLVFITNKNFRIIYKDMAYKCKNNKDTPLPNHYIRYHLRSSLHHEWR